jgi:hypothetical protein
MPEADYRVNSSRRDFMRFLGSLIEPLESRIAPAFAAALDLSSLTLEEGFTIKGGDHEDHLASQWRSRVISTEDGL